MGDISFHTSPLRVSNSIWKTKEALSIDKASFVRPAHSLQGAVDRAEGVTDLWPEQTDDRDHNDCDEHEDDGVLDQPLSPFLWME